MRPEFYNMSVPTAATGAGAPFPSGNFREKWVQVKGTFVGSLDIEGSDDDVTWFKIASGIVAPSAVQVPVTCKSLRVNVTSYTSGQPAAILGGFNARAV